MSVDATAPAVSPHANAERERLQLAESRDANWQRWGTYLPERQWGTLREDYSAEGKPWEYFPYEMAQYRAYRWGEDGLLGWTDRECRLCFSVSLWNGQDATLKERLFGLGNNEGNHGEDVKELFYYLDATPTHSYAKALYKYPHAAFPYESLREEGRRRGLSQPEFELLDTGIFDDGRYFDVQVEYAKADVEDMFIRLTVTNRGPETATLHLLPTLAFRNTWSWDDSGRKPRIVPQSGGGAEAEHEVLGRFRFEPVPLHCEDIQPESLLTENESNASRLDQASVQAAVPSKDAFDRYVVHGERNLLSTDVCGTKFAFHCRADILPEGVNTLLFRLYRLDGAAEPKRIGAAEAAGIFEQRQAEADDFYATILPSCSSREEKRIARQAYAGLLWTKQYYGFDAQRWMDGDRTGPDVSADRARRLNDWRHIFSNDILSMPDKWEYPWFAAWDLAFHMLPMAEIDPAFAKWQLLLLLREWYMHPNGQLPAYEGSFGAVNPPVHAWAVWHVYRMDAQRNGKPDIDFLERAFQKLLLNFTWWVNRNDAQGRNLFNGGFLGLDNIGVFDRSQVLPDGATLQQADATAWMGLFCGVMLQTALELAKHRSCAYEDIASRFFEHYVTLIEAMNTANGTGLWSEEDGFYFDRLNVDGQPPLALRARTMVGIVPLFAVCILDRAIVAELPGFKKRLQWFLEHKPHLQSYVLECRSKGLEGSHWMAIAPRERFDRILRRMLDETEFLSQHGIRALSRAHLEKPFAFNLAGRQLTMGYVPAESDSTMFGGNSNWRGPVWFPVNVLIVNALERYYLAVGDTYRVEYPTGSGQQLTLQQVADELRRRLIALFLPDAEGRRPCHGSEMRYALDPAWRDLILFSEYFSGDDGRGIGASHQTGWTATIATVIGDLYKECRGSGA